MKLLAKGLQVVVMEDLVPLVVREALMDLVVEEEADTLMGLLQS